MDEGTKMQSFNADRLGSGLCPLGASYGIAASSPSGIS